MGRAADRLGRVERNLKAFPEQAVRSSTKDVRAVVLRELETDAGSDRKLSGVRNGVEQTVVVKVENRLAGQFAQGGVKAGPQRQRAPWFWLEEGTESGQRNARRTRATGELRARGGGNHPGTPAKHTWSRAVGKVVPAVRKTFEDLFSKAVQ